MADGQIQAKPSVLFLNMADKDFGAEVRMVLAALCQIDVGPTLYTFPTKSTASIVVVALSSDSLLAEPNLKKLTSGVRREAFLLVFPDSTNIKTDAFVQRITKLMVDTRTTYWTTNLAQLPHHIKSLLPSQRHGTIIDAKPGAIFPKDTGGLQSYDPQALSAIVLAESAQLTSDFSVTFDQSLTPEQIKATLTVLANYYRTCGGVGLSVEFENQEAVPEEVHA
jgi:hypothetical protein